MKDAHKGRGINNSDFDKVGGHVVSTMQDLGVPEDLVKEVADLLETVRADTVTA
jgi:truncated hemoglobin YjbI